MNRKDLENNAPINIDIITAGNGDMTVSEFDSLATIVKDTNGNLHHSVNAWWDETFFPCREKEQIFEVDDLVQQGTVSHLSDEEVIIESDMKAFQLSLKDFKSKLKEVYQSQKHPQEYDCFSEKLKEIILEQLYEEELNKSKKPINEILKDNRIFLCNCIFDKDLET